MSADEKITKIEDAKLEAEKILEDVADHLKVGVNNTQEQEDFNNESTQLKEDIDDFIEEIKIIKKEDNPDVKSLENDKKNLIKKLQKCRKQVEDKSKSVEKQMQKLEKAKKKGDDKAKNEKKEKSKLTNSNEKDVKIIDENNNEEDDVKNKKGEDSEKKEKAEDNEENDKKKKGDKKDKKDKSDKAKNIKISGDNVDKNDEDKSDGNEDDIDDSGDNDNKESKKKNKSLKKSKLKGSKTDVSNKNEDDEEEENDDDDDDKKKKKKDKSLKKSKLKGSKTDVSSKNKDDDDEEDDDDDDKKKKKKDKSLKKSKLKGSKTDVSSKNKDGDDEEEEDDDDDKKKKKKDKSLKKSKLKGSKTDVSSKNKDGDDEEDDDDDDQKKKKKKDKSLKKSKLKGSKTDISSKNGDEEDDDDSEGDKKTKTDIKDNETMEIEKSIKPSEQSVENKSKSDIKTQSPKFVNGAQSAASEKDMSIENIEHIKPTNYNESESAVHASKKSDDTQLPVTEKDIKRYRVLKIIKAKEEDDLNCKQGDILEYIEDCDDNEYVYVKNINGEEGYVPIDHIMIISDDKSVTVDEVDSIEQRSLGETGRATSLSEMYHVPLKERDIKNVLMEYGNLPSGFRLSTLENWTTKDFRNLDIYYSLNPKLSDSLLSFKDLQVNTDSKLIKPRTTRIQRCVQINKAVQMVSVSERFNVQTEYLKMCLFNGEKPISNIYSIRAIPNDKDHRIWNFNNKVSDITKSREFYEVFIRTDDQSNNLDLLIEFCIYGRKKSDEENNNSESSYIEFSCGWCKVPLYEKNGQPINNKNSDYPLNGGSPFDDDVEIDPENVTATSSLLKSSNKGSQVSIKIYPPSKENKEYLETLSDNVIGSTLHLPLFSYFRRILASRTFDKRTDMTAVDPIYSPFLKAFQSIMHQNDILDALRTAWLENLKTNKTVNKKDPQALQLFFEEVFMKYIFPITRMTDLPPLDVRNRDSDKVRGRKIDEFIQQSKENVVIPLLSDNFSFSPLSYNEMVYVPVMQHSNKNE